MTINEIYKLVQIFANKEQRGFITPSDFNLLAKQAELELYNKRLSIVKQKAPMGKSQGVYQESLTPELARQDIAGFLVVQVIATLTDGSTSMPSDHIEAIYSSSNSDSFDIDFNIPVEIVEEKDISAILRSSLAKPSLMYPVALLSMSGNNTSNDSRKGITIFPSNVKNLRVYHYIYDRTPRWNYTTVAGKPVYNENGSTGFTISERVHGELVIKILEYLGVNIREAEVVQYAQANELKADS